MSKRFLLVGHDLGPGGAGLALYRFYKLLSKSYEAEILIADRQSSEYWIKNLLSYILIKIFIIDKRTKHSFNLFGLSKIQKRVLSTCSDEILNVHWINNEVLSISTIGKLPPNTIITLHDNWLIEGTRHTPQQAISDGSALFRIRASIERRISKFFLDRKISLIGKRDDLIICVPSSHLLDLCRASPVTANKKCVRLPNCIDTQSFQPNLVDKAFMSNLRRLTFGYNDLILVFAANKGTQNKLKGWDILFSIVKNSQMKKIAKFRSLFVVDKTLKTITLVTLKLSTSDY